MPTFNKLTATAMVILTFLSGCDLVQPDADVAPRDIDATIYAFAGKPAVINLATVTNGMDLRIDQLTSTKFGEVRPVVGGKYVLYLPTAAFSGESEVITLPLLGTDNQKFANLKLRARSLDNFTGCSDASGVYDYAKVKSGETLVIDLLDNDIFCNVGYNGGLIGEVALEGGETNDFVLSLGPGRQAKFTYTPDPGFKGKFKLIYNLGINWKDAGVSYDEAVKNPAKYLEAFTTALVEVDVE